jgi:hypothetical protein
MALLWVGELGEIETPGSDELSGVSHFRSWDDDCNKNSLILSVSLLPPSRWPSKGTKPLQKRGKLPSYT